MDAIGPVLAGVVLAVLVVLLLVARSAKAAPKGRVDERLTKDLAAGNYEAVAVRELNAGHLETALDMFLRAQQPARAALVAQRLGRLKDAAALYEKSGDRVRAAKLYRQAGFESKAAEIEGGASPPGPGGPSGAAAPAKGQSPGERARELETVFRDARRKAEGGDPAAIIDLQRAARQAADAWLAAGDTRRAAEVFRDAGLIEDAVNLYLNLLNDPGSAALLLAERGEHQRAAELYEAAGQKERALASWIDWSASAADPLAHVTRIQGLAPDALGRFVDGVQARVPVEASKLDLYQRMARTLEAHGDAPRVAALQAQIRRLESPARSGGPEPAGGPTPAAPEFLFGGGADPNLPPLPDPPPLGSVQAAAQQAPVDPPSPAAPAAATPPHGSAAPAGAPAVQSPAAAPAAHSDLQKLMSEVAAAAAREVFDALSQRADGAMPVLARGAPQPPMGRRGVDALDVPVVYGADAAVQAAKIGPSAGDLRRLIGAAPVQRSNVQAYYQLGLALVGGGQWAEARKAFEAVEVESPGYRDVAERLAEIDRWQEAVSASRFGRSADGERRYSILGELGRGGMAVVYRARDEALDREVALKFVLEGAGSEDMMRELFQREARAVASLNHPNIVAVYDVGVIEGRPFLCMELVDGTNVEKILARRGKLAVIEAIEIVEKVLDALEFAHARKIIHRDIKPANVMLTKDGRVKLMDFGLAKSLDSRKTTMISGTPGYMSPEQLAGKPLDPRTDLFALGASLYEMLSGRMPFEGASRDRPPLPLQSLNSAVPKLLDRTVSRSLEADPDRRFASAAEMLGPVRTILKTVKEFAERQVPGAGSTGSTAEPPTPQPILKIGLVSPARATASPRPVLVEERVRQPTSAPTAAGARSAAQDGDRTEKATVLDARTLKGARIDPKPNE